MDGWLLTDPEPQVMDHLFEGLGVGAAVQRLEEARNSCHERLPAMLRHLKNHILHYLHYSGRPHAT